MATTILISVRDKIINLRNTIDEIDIVKDYQEFIRLKENVININEEFAGIFSEITANFIGEPDKIENYIASITGIIEAQNTALKRDWILIGWDYHVQGEINKLISENRELFIGLIGTEMPFYHVRWLKNNFDYSEKLNSLAQEHSELLKALSTGSLPQSKRAKLLKQLRSIEPAIDCLNTYNNIWWKLINVGYSHIKFDYDKIKNALSIDKFKIAYLLFIHLNRLSEDIQGQYDFLLKNSNSKKSLKQNETNTEYKKENRDKYIDNHNYSPNIEDFKEKALIEKLDQSNSSQYLKFLRNEKERYTNARFYYQCYGNSEAENNLENVYGGIITFINAEISERLGSDNVQPEFNPEEYAAKKMKQINEAGMITKQLFLHQGEITQSFEFIEYVSKYKNEGIEFKIWIDKSFIVTKEIAQHNNNLLVKDTEKIRDIFIAQHGLEKFDQLMERDANYFNNEIGFTIPRHETNTEVENEMVTQFCLRRWKDEQALFNERRFIEREIAFLNEFDDGIKEAFKYQFYPILQYFENIQSNGGLQTNNEQQIPQGIQESENDYAFSTITDYLEPFRAKMKANDYENITTALKQYFDTGKFPKLSR